MDYSLHALPSAAKYNRAQNLLWQRQVTIGPA